jgi:hypothetical protein
MNEYYIIYAKYMPMFYVNNNLISLSWQISRIIFTAGAPQLTFN